VRNFYVGIFIIIAAIAVIYSGAHTHSELRTACGFIYVLIGTYDIISEADVR